MIIDCHAHMFAFEQIRPYKWMKDTLLSADQQIKLMDAKGIHKAVILPLHHAESPVVDHQSFGEVLYICKKYPDRFIPFCNLDPRATDVGELKGVEKFEFWLSQYKELGCKGLGEFTSRLRWQDSCVEHLLKACENLGFPVTFHTSTEDKITYGLIDDIGLPGLEGALNKFPDLKFFGHSQAFWSEMSGDLKKKDKNRYPKGKVTKGGTVTKLMRRYPNLYGDLSAGSGLNALQRDPDHAWQFVDEFQDRLMLGLDYCSTANDMQHIEWLTQAKDDGNISKKAYEKIVWKNVNKALNLGL